jgi:hypothetical protein
MLGAIEVTRVYLHYCTLFQIPLASNDGRRALQTFRQSSSSKDLQKIFGCSFRVQGSMIQNAENETHVFNLLPEEK